jgi:hypothetical protein
MQTFSIAFVLPIAAESVACDRSTADKCAGRFGAQYNFPNYLSNRRSNRKASPTNN